MNWHVFLLFLLPLSVWGQQSFYIQDAISKDPIPFVKVIPNTGSPVLADLDGHFVLSNNIQSFTLRYSGYADTNCVIATLQDSVILWLPNVQMIDEITVVPGVNPAHRIVGKAIENRKNNHPKKDLAFQYDSYSKFVFEFNPEFIASIPDTVEDSTLIKIRDFSNQQHLFLMESASKRTFQPPFRDQEEITAYKVSGLSDPRLSTFANSMQSFSFYDNQFEVLGVPYINPLALGGLNRYLFVLEDTTFNASDTTYTIYFRPKLGKSFHGIEGRMYINTNGFAVEKVVASPYKDSSGFSLRIVQEYAYLNNRKWFPVKLSSELDFGNMVALVEDESASIIGTGYTVIEHVVFDPEDKPRWKENSIELYTADDANELDEKIWDSLRGTKITAKEQQTYHTIDSISEAMGIEKRMHLLDALLDGKIPLGYVNMDLNRLVDFNHYERYRFGLGLETSTKLMKPVMIGGYFAWATRDKEWKWGGYSTIHLMRKKGMRLELSYKDDVFERGGNQFMSDGFDWSSTDLYRDFYITNMDRARMAEAAFRMDVRANLTVRLAGTYSRYLFKENYVYLPLDMDGADLAVSTFEVKWSPFEKYVMLGDKKSPQRKKYPVLRFKLDRGWSGIAESEIDFTKLSAQITQKITLMDWVTFDWKISAQKLMGNTPLFLASVGDGTGLTWNVATPGTFETMAPSSFYSTEQISTFLRVKFRPIHTKMKWNEPQFGLHHAWGIGTFNDRSAHNVAFQTMDKGFAETGILLDGVLVSGFTRLGVGVFYNYSSYGDSDWKKNVYPKFSIGFNLD